MIDSDISHEEFTVVINKEQNYFRLKESLKAKEVQLKDFEQDRSVEHDKRIRQHEGLSLKSKTDV